MPNGRSELQQEVISALVESKAVNFDAVASVIAKHGPRLTRSGDEFAFVITKKSWDLCIPPEPYRVVMPTLTNDQDA